MTDRHLEIGPPPEEARASAVLIHGRGARAESMLTIAEALTLHDVHYRAPQAPGFSWYPHSFLAPLSANDSGIRSGLAAIRGHVDALEAAGVPAERVVLLGFSQGACLALEFAARHARRYGAVVAFSGGLIGNVQLHEAKPPRDKGFDYAGALDGTPVFLGCSDDDPHIPLERVRQTQQAMMELGGEVDMRIYEGMGHTINDDELQAVRRLLSDVTSSS